MIAYLEGRLEAVLESSIIVVTDGGVGYEVEVTARFRQALPETGARVSLYATLIVREDALRLCGFATLEERAVFDVLVGLPKVGPKLALGILSVYPPSELRRVVAEGDNVALTAVGGIGRRLSELIFRELAYRLKVEPLAGPAAGLAPGGAGTLYRDVVAALKGMGFQEGECGGVVRDLIREQPDLDAVGAVRAALRELGRKK